MAIRSIVKSLARRAGVDLGRWSPSIGCRRDAFYAISHLLDPATVRTVFDVGANVGQSARTFLEAFPRADVWSFEPFPDACDQMRRAIDGNPRAHIQQCAIAEAPGRTTFHVNAASETNSLLPTLAESARVIGHEGIMSTARTIDVPVTSIDEFCREQGIQNIDLLKIDVQGVTDKVILGAARALKEKRIRLVYTEVMFMQIYHGEPCFPEIDKLIQGFGYPLYGLYNLQNPRGRMAWGDAIYVEPKLLDQHAEGG